MEGGDTPRRQSPRKKSLAEIQAEARKKMLSNTAASGGGGSANSSVLVEDPDATALAAKVKRNPSIFVSK